MNWVLLGRRQDCRGFILYAEPGGTRRLIPVLVRYGADWKLRSHLIRDQVKSDCEDSGDRIARSRRKRYDKQEKYNVREMLKFEG